MSEKVLDQLRIDLIKVAIGHLEKAPNPMPSEMFTNFVSAAIDLGVPREKLRKELGVSAAAVDRWYDGLAAPHPAVAEHGRQTMLRFLKEELFELSA